MLYRGSVPSSILGLFLKMNNLGWRCLLHTVKRSHYSYQKLIQAGSTVYTVSGDERFNWLMSVEQIHKCNLSWICLCNQLRVSPVCCLIELILNYSLNKIWGLRRLVNSIQKKEECDKQGGKEKYKTVLMTHAFQQKTLQKHHSSLSPKNCAINTFFHLFYRSASNDSLPLPLSFFRRLSSPSADSVQITSVLSLHSFICHRRAKIAPCCSPSFAFITGAARERQQAAPSDPRLCCLLDCHVTGACWLGKFSGSHHTY